MPKEINLCEIDVEVSSEENSVETIQETIFVEDSTESPLYPNKLKNGHLDHAKAPEIDDRKKEEAKRIIEALLFSCNEPLPLAKIKDIVSILHPFPSKNIVEILKELQQEYLAQQRSVQLDEIAQGYLLRTREAYSVYVNMLQGNRRVERLSPAATEVVAIVAYRQPLTRADIDAIRGVDSSGTLASLLERGLVEVVGKLEVPGRPSLFGTTKKFLHHFGLRDLSELPAMEKLPKSPIEKS